MIGNPAQITRKKVLIFPQVIADNALLVGSVGSTPVSLDTQLNGIKSRYVEIIVILGSIDATIAKMNVYESDDDSSYAEIAGLDWVADTSIEPGANDDNKMYSWMIDLRGSRKRYYQVELQAGNGAAGTYATVIAIEHQLSEAPTTAAARGLAAHFIDTNLVSA